MKITGEKKNITTVLLLLLSILSFTTLNAQEKTRKVIHLEHADSALYNESIVKDAQRLFGNVKLSHENVILICDSAWFYGRSNSIDCFSHVHIISNDTLHMYAKTINYKGDESFAKARGEVMLKDPKMTLTTDSLDFDTKNEIGYYDHWGKIVDSTNTLTSLIGRYYSKNNELFFQDSVKLVNPDYVMISDTMKYNTKSEIVQILGPTHITGDSTSLYSENGWFDTQHNTSELLKNSTIRRGDTELKGDYIYYNDNTGEGNARNNVVITDFKNSMIVAGNKATYNDFSKYAYVADSALFIQYNNKDSLYLHADTLYTRPDTIDKNQKAINAYHHIRFYKKDMQGMCDSLVYNTKDSTIQLFTTPVLWTENDQLTADYIELVNKSVPPSMFYLKNNSFIVQELDSSKYNQIKGKDMEGYIANSKLYRINVSGNGQSIYYPADKKSFIGVNKAESSNIILYLNDNKIKRITFIKSPIGTLSPVLEKVDPDTKLEGFSWKGDERPLNRLDIFGRKVAAIIPPVPQDSTVNKLVLPIPAQKDSTKEALPGK